MIEKSLAFLEDVALAELRFRTSKNSHIPNRGIYLPWPHSKLISEGNEKVVLKNRKYNIAGVDFLYCDNKFAYGILKVDDSKKVATREEFTELRKFYKLTDSESKDWDRSKPLFVYPIKEVHNFDLPIQMDLPKEIHNFIVSPIQYLELGDKYPFDKKELPSNPARPVIPFPIQLKCPNCGEWIDVPHQPIPQKCPKCGGEIWKEASKNLIKSTALPKEEYEVIVKDYELKPLPDKYYKSRKDGKAFAQMHLRGLIPDDREAWEKGELSFQKLILEHSLHVDLRLKLKGLDKLVQYVITESDMKSYIRGMKGELNPEQAGPANVQKVKIISKPSGEPPEGLPKTKEKGDMLIDKKGANIIDKCILHKRSYIIPKGEIGATPLTDAYLGLIWEGEVKEGIMREDMHEYFFYSDNDLPDLNKKLFNGRFIIRCFKGTEGRANTWWMWKATKNSFPINSWCHIDKGFHYLISADTVKKFGHESYKEWGARKKDC